MKFRIIRLLILSGVIIMACTKENINRTIIGQFSFGQNISYPCVDIDTTTYFLRYTLEDHQVCLDRDFLLSHPNCGTGIPSPPSREILASPPFNGEIDPMPIVRFQFIRHLHSNHINTEESILGTNLLLGDIDEWRVQASLWFSNRKMCPEDRQNSLHVDRVQVFSASPFLSAPYGDSSYFIVTDIETLTNNLSGSFIISFRFRLDVFDANHKQLKIRSGEGRVPISL